MTCNPDPVREGFRWAVYCLAQPAEMQLSLLPEFVCKADELALTFDDGLRELGRERSELSPHCQASLDALEAWLCQMSEAGDEGLWTDNAVRNHPSWRVVRLLATAVLAAFEWDAPEPSPRQDVYVPAASG